MESLNTPENLEPSKQFRLDRINKLMEGGMSEAAAAQEVDAQDMRAKLNEEEQALKQAMKEEGMEVLGFNEDQAA